LSKSVARICDSGPPRNRVAAHCRVHGRVSVRSAIAALALVLAACGPQNGSLPTHLQPQREILTRDEILSSTASTADLLQAIQSLRPNFLATHPSAHSRRSAAAQPLAVFIGVNRQTGLEALKSISAANVAEVRYLDPTASQNMFGLSATGGALVIKLYDASKNPDAGSE